MKKANRNEPSVGQRLSVIETILSYLGRDIKDIKDNHLKTLNSRITGLSNRLWWLLGILVVILLGIVLRAKL
jgi:hypothetical protein